MTEKNKKNVSPDFYEELDHSKIQDGFSSFAFWSFVIFWSIICLVGVLIILLW